jgi:DNA gyrase/topoisomerase IV subunit B
MSATTQAVLRALNSVDQAVNRKVNAELARVIYQNPEAAMLSIENAIKRAQAAQRPARAARAAPAVGGVAGAAFTEERARQLQPER